MLHRISHDTINTNRASGIFCQRPLVSWRRVRDEMLSLFLRVGECDIAIEARSVSSGRPPNQERGLHTTVGLILVHLLLDQPALGRVAQRDTNLQRDYANYWLTGEIIRAVHVWRRSEQWLVFNLWSWAIRQSLRLTHCEWRWVR